MLSYSNFGDVKGCVGNPNMSLPDGSCVRQQLGPDGRVPEGGCEGPEGEIPGVETPGYVNQNGFPPCCVANPPKACISTGGASQGTQACGTPRNQEGRPDSIYNKSGKRVGSVDQCSNCGNYHYSDGIGCFKLKYDSASNSCVEDGGMLKNYDSNCRLIKSTGNGGTGKLPGVPPPDVKPTGNGGTGNLSGVPRPSSNGSLVGSSGSKPTSGVPRPSSNGSLVGSSGSKPSSPGGGVNPIIIVLVVLAVLALLYFLLRKKKVLKTLFGKRR
jgi:hypothetical protein